MFDISWNEIVVIAVVALIFIGPKDLPGFLSTMGRYTGMIRRKSSEFREQLEEAVRQVELDAIKKEINNLQTGIETDVHDSQVQIPTAGELYT